MADDFTPPRDQGPSTRWLVKSVNHIKPDQLGDVEIGVTDIVDGTPGNGDTIIYNSITQVFEFGPPHGSEIDQAEVTSDAADLFSLTHIPIDRSWNVTYNGVTQRNDVDYTIVGRTLTVTAPTDMFAAADPTYPGLLEVQYDYLLGGSTPVVYGDISFQRSNTGSATVTAPAGFVTGDVGVHVVYVLSKDGPTGGTPSGWTPLEASTVTSDGARTHYTASFWKVADDADVGATFTYGATGPDAKDTTWVFVRAAATVHDAGYAHHIQSAGASLAFPAVTADADAVVLRFGAGRQSTGPMSITISQGAAAQTDAGTSGDLVTSVSQESVTAGAVTAATADSNGACAMSCGVFVVQ